MAKQQKFWTGLLPMRRVSHEPRPPYKGLGWEATAVPHQQVHCRYRRSEIALLARSWASAQRALDLIIGCFNLLAGECVLDRLTAHNAIEPKWMSPDERMTAFVTVSTHSIPLACAVAAKASHRRKWVYAVEKYMFSLSIYYVSVMDHDPAWGSPHLPVSSLPSDHIKFAHAIVSAYGVVEDLGLMVGASAQKPSRINGEWNPAVKHDLEGRLTKAGVDIGETILWAVRGPKRKIELRRPVPSVTKAPWSRWTVRDCEVPLVDAIAYAEWLRSAVASHATKDLTRVISPYDVINVQHLARRLLLETLGFWRWRKKRTAGAH